MSFHFHNLTILTLGSLLDPHTPHLICLEEKVYTLIRKYITMFSSPRLLTMNIIDIFWYDTWVGQKFCNILENSGTIRLFQMFVTNSWSWQTTLNCEMPYSPDTLWVLLTSIASGTGLDLVDFVWSSGFF